MVQTVEISKAAMLQKYSRKGVEDLVLIDGKLYGRTTEGQANNPDSYIIVYCVV